MLELNDCGRDVLLRFGMRQTEKKIIVVIKAPKGTMVLFDNHYISPDTQCEAIKAFMEEHSDD